MLTYLSQLPLAGALGVAAFMTLLYAIAHKVAAGTAPSYRRLALAGVTFLYACLFALLFLVPSSLQPTTAVNLGAVVQLVPFRTIAHASPAGTIGNALALLPLPILAHLHGLARKQVIMLALLVPLLIEPAQLLIDALTGFPNFVVDIDDLIMQLAGSLLGLGIVTLMERRAARDRSASASARA